MWQRPTQPQHLRNLDVSLEFSFVLYFFFFLGFFFMSEQMIVICGRQSVLKYQQMCCCGARTVPENENTLQNSHFLIFVSPSVSEAQK